jgi:hypothetical protein
MITTQHIDEFHDRIKALADEAFEMGLNNESSVLLVVFGACCAGQVLQLARFLDPFTRNQIDRITAIRGTN